MAFSARARQRLLVGALLCLLVLVAASVLVTTQRTWLDVQDQSLGAPLTRWADRHGTVESVLRGIQVMFATAPVFAYTAIVAGWLAARHRRRTAFWVIMVIFGQAVTMWTMKALFGRPRPDTALISLRDTSFPSGHSSGIAAAAGVAIVLAYLFLHRRRRLVVVVALTMMLVVGLDRVLLGVHNPSDVIAGWALGGLWVMGAVYLADPSPRPLSPVPATGAVTATRRAAIVVNPTKIVDQGGFRALVDQMAADSGYALPMWMETTAADPGRSMAERAAVEGVDIVLVAGGDGTVRTVCAELAGTGVPVGVVPVGTGNLLARNLALPLYVRAAVDVGLNGQDRAIDLVAISGDGIGEDEAFLVMAGMGFDAAIMEGANERVKARVGWLAYVVSGMRHLMFPVVGVEISLDDRPFTRHRARTVVVGNVGMLQGGLPLLPDATLDDGLLDVVLIYPARFLSWLRVVARVVSRNRRTDETVTRMTGRRVVIRTSIATPRQIDGDPVGSGTELTCEVQHGRLLVRVPR